MINKIRFLKRYSKLLFIIFISTLMSFFFYWSIGQKNKTLFLLLDQSIALLFLICLISTPFIIILFVLKRGSKFRTVLELHSSLFFSVIFVSKYFTFASGHSSPASSLANDLHTLSFSIVFFESTALFFTRIYDKQEKQIKLVFLITSSIVLGWLVGGFIWALTVPNLIISQAEDAARENTYCILAVDRQVRSWWDLTGYNMKSPNMDGWQYSFHGLLVIGNAKNRQFMNWSYKDKKFNVIADQTRRNLRLETLPQCEPTPHFAKNLHFFNFIKKALDNNVLEIP